MAKAPKTQLTGRESSAWMGFAYREPTNRGTIRIRPRWGKIILLTLLFMSVFWMGKSVAFYYFFRELRNFEEVSFVDMLVFPINQASVRTEQGNYQIEEAKKALERENYRRALGLLRNGLTKSPSHTEGRLLLARIYSNWRPDLAIQVLADGLAGGREDPEYVKLLFALLLSRKEDARVLELSEDLLGHDLSPEVLLISRIARLQSAIFRGKYDIARKIFQEAGVKYSPDGVLTGTQLYRHIGRTDEARKLLETILASRPKGDLSAMYAALIRILIDNGLEDEAREQALSFTIRNPLDWKPRIFLIETLQSDGRMERQDNEMERFMLQYRNNEEAITNLARLCAGNGNVRATERLYEIALENDFNLGTFTLFLIKAQIQDGRYQEAISMCNELAGESPAWMVSETNRFNAYRSMAYLLSGNDELGSLYLNDFLDSRDADGDLLHDVAWSMNTFGLFPEALQVLEKAHLADPSDEAILSLLIDVEMKLGAYFSIDKHLRTLFSLRQPSFEILSDFHRRLQSDRFILVKDRNSLLAELERMIREMEKMDLDIWNLSGSGAS